MKKEILKYLQGPRTYAEGLALYNKYGWNPHLKRSLTRIGETESTKKTLIEELRKLAGLTDKEFNSLKRLSRQSIEEEKVELSKEKFTDDLLIDLASRFNVTVDELISDEFAERIQELDYNEDKIEELEDELEDARQKYEEAPEPVIKMIRFREKFTFLRDVGCPDILKVLVNDLFVSYDGYREAYAKLQQMPDDVATVQAEVLASQVVGNYIDNREMWEELEHYQSTHDFLGKCELIKNWLKMTEFSNLSDIDLTSALNNARANLSKSKTKLKNATSDEKIEEAKILVDKWEKQRDDLTLEFELRKKK